MALRRSSAAARSLALGFAGAVAMWVLAYVAMMRPGMLLGEALFGLTLACAGVAGHVAGRDRLPSEPGWIAGVKTGLVIATLNMLLIGSLVGGESRGERMTQLLLWTASNYAITLALAAIGGVLGARGAYSAHPAQGVASYPRNWFSLFTRVAAVTVFLLLITGGLVTGLEAGLAVPDWPSSFGHNMLLYPLSQMVGGVYYEHAHRLYGMLVGVTAITLAVSAFFFDDRKWLRGLAITYLLMVCVQGYMGGTRVTETSVPLAIIHGVFGQVVFATACAIAAFTSPRWLDTHAPITRPGADTDRRWSLALAAALLLQLALGALYRHTLQVHVLYTHILWAAFATGLIIFVGGRAWAKHADLPPLPRLGKAMLHTVGLQIVLGVAATIAVWSRPSAPPTSSGAATPVGVIPLWEVVVTSAHQATGALLLALAILTMVWTRRLLSPSQPAA
jgi:heme A synthase